MQRPGRLPHLVTAGFARFDPAVKCKQQSTGHVRSLTSQPILPCRHIIAALVSKVLFDMSSAPLHPIQYLPQSRQRKTLVLTGWVCQHWNIDACRPGQESNLGQPLRKLLEAFICYMVVMIGILILANSRILFSLLSWTRCR